MNAYVERIYKDGKRIPIGKIQTANGELNVSGLLHPIMCRLTVEAVLLDDIGNAIPPIWDVQLTSISKNGLRLRGFELNAGRKTAQEWWVRFALDPEQRKRREQKHTD